MIYPVLADCQFGVSYLIYTTYYTHAPSLSDFSSTDFNLAPALVAVEYVEYDLENMFDQPSIYRGPPTPVLEKAWSDLWLGELTDYTLLSRLL